MDRLIFTFLFYCCFHKSRLWYCTCWAILDLLKDLLGFMIHYLDDCDCLFSGAVGLVCLLKVSTNWDRLTRGGYEEEWSVRR